ncbi:hypothetical protein [Microbacterium marinilacus]|uniref:Sortase n=1 Tax=Microbacterium marinilacus TaxID=415209 RepID=A0ABP7BAS0_9MICO|nr:hypothetical protein [Microbacterium marinilacus]MBY0687050.1 hypothetical protein [Microbacterium marinilacus]
MSTPGGRRSGRARRAIGAALLVISAAMAMSVWSAFSAEAAQYVPDRDQATPDRMLSLWTQGAPEEARSLSPGEPVSWLIRADHDDRTGPATIDVQLRKQGALVDHPRGLSVSIEQCMVPWAGWDTATPWCPAPGGALTVTPEHDLSEAPSDPMRMGDMVSSIPHYFRVTAALEDSPAARADASLHGLSAVVDIGVTATGGGGATSEGPEEGDGPPDAGSDGARDPVGLTPTGGDLGDVARLLALAAAAIAAALGARLLRRRPEPAS